MDILESETAIDLFDTQTLASLSDRELMECIIAFQQNIVRDISAIMEVHKMVKEAIESLADNPMLRMMGLQMG